MKDRIVAALVAAFEAERENGESPYFWIETPTGTEARIECIAAVIEKALQ